MTGSMRPCPVCTARQPHVLFRQQFEPTALNPMKGYDVVVCERCGAGYADGIAEQSAFDKYYRELSKYEYQQRDGAESEYDRARLAASAAFIASAVTDRTVRVLDVGCATGRLLAELRQLGFKTLVGLDPSPACAAAAMRLYGIEVRTTTLADLQSSGGSFDVVIMVGVLEHLREASESLQHIKAVQEVGGLLYVEVPDATAFADWPNAPYQDFSTEHINFFSPVSLDNLLRTHGFQRVTLKQDHRIQSHATVMSNISAVYRRVAEVQDDIEFDATTKAGLIKYIDSCALGAESLQSKINGLAETGQPILVWGVGTHTARLMATSRLAEANILAFVESNTRYHGQSLGGRPIVSPEHLRDYAEPVLISSRVFQHEIAKQIREGLGCSNELILLYDL